MADSNREIDAVFHQIDHAIRQPQIAGHSGINLQIFRHDRTDMETPEPDRRRDYQPAARRRPLVLRRIFGFLDITENAARAFQVARTDIGQRHRPRGPLQQPRAKMLFQRGDQPRYP